ncbi:cation efflux protein, CzcI family [Massilia sp. S19_KUP03_FR1]|uniref:cation efflux protein, CzcI family n=1 Tax=Massilia sp. S19_KUP03_FR1 TaxID=3025503 RepID=UPI002FCDCCC9
MKRLLLILLMLILPVQYAWSAAAVYCQHEQNAPVHFGHHAHQHDAKPGEPDGHGKVKVKGADADCEYCHLFSHASFVPFASRPAVPAARAQVASLALTYTSHIPHRPPRPNWSLVA